MGELHIPITFGSSPIRPPSHSVANAFLVVVHAPAPVSASTSSFAFSVRGTPGSAAKAASAGLASIA